MFDLSDMYIEDVADAFDTLDDAEEATASTGDLGEEHVEAEDLFDEDTMPEEDEEEAAEESEEESEDDEEESEEEPEDEEGESEEAEEEEEEIVDFDEYEVTLPNGSIVKLNEAIKGYRDAETLQQERSELEEQRVAFEESMKGYERKLALAELEASRVIKDYDGFDWATLSREDPAAYVENREFLDNYKTRHAEILAEMESIEADRKETEEAAMREAARVANNILSQDIPGWNKEVYEGLMHYGVEKLGMDEEFVLNCTNPGIFKALYNSMQLEQGKQTVTAKIKKLSKASSPKKVVKAAPRQAKQEGGKKAAAIRKLESGQFDDQDLGDIFSMLED